MQTPSQPQATNPSVEQTPVTRLDFSRIAQDLQIRKVQVEAVVQLLDEGNTVPFITRYRKERTGGLNEEVIRIVQGRVAQLRQLADRKQTILKSIEGQGKLTEELRAAIIAAESPKRLEDLYLPYKPKKRTLATTARERGLEPLALAIWSGDPAVANLGEVLPTLVNPEKQLNSTEDVLLGVQHILAEQVAETADIRAAVRAVLWDTGKLCTAKSEKVPEGEGLDFKDYFQFTEPIRHVPPHRILAINRGEKENVLTVRLQCDAEQVQRVALEKLPLAAHPHAEFLRTVTADALARLGIPSLEREIRRELTTRAEQHAVTVFARNLRSLLLQPPLRGRKVLAIDPGFRTGCKVACLDETGNLIEDAVVYPHPPHPRPHGRKPAAAAPAPAGPAPEGTIPAPDAKEEAPPVYRKREEAKAKLEELIRKHGVNVIAIGNGTACRETEEVVSDVIAALEQGRPAGRLEPMPPGVPPGLATTIASGPAACPPALTAQYSSGGPTTQPSLPPPEIGTQYSVLSTQYALLEIPSAEPSAPVADFAAHYSAPSPVPGEPSLSPVETSVPHSMLSTVYSAPTAPLEGAPPADLAVPASPGPVAVQPPGPSLPPPPADLAYVIVNEAGASVYSASAVGREEFPGYDATLRGTISIGRRLQDPLSELVKIDPQNIGVGLYQHDVSPKQLRESLDAIIESCVNQVGVDLNTASVPLLRHVSGLNQLAARELVEYRKQHGPFRSREQLLQVPGIGEARYVQAAGFLKIEGGENALDRTWIHPESYPVARQLLIELGYGPEALEAKDKAEELREKLKGLSPEEISARLQVGTPTVRDIVDALARPGRDPREDLPSPIFKKGILKLEDLQPAMQLKGTVLNVVDFGAFVDIGLKDSGLVHISQMANRYIKNPYEVVAVGDVVTVWVLAVDTGRRRVSLSMIRPGTERKPAERKPHAPRQEQREGPPRSRPPRGRRPSPARGRGAPAPQVTPPPQQGEQPAAAVARVGQPGNAAHDRPRGGGPRPPLPPRRPHRPTPKPKLSQAALQGDAPLRTFGELAAFLEAKERDVQQPEPAAAAAGASAGAEDAPPANS
jgi:uncharacterized protein